MLCGEAPPWVKTLSGQGKYAGSKAEAQSLKDDCESNKSPFLSLE